MPWARGNGGPVTVRPCAAPASSWCPTMTRPATSMPGRSAPRWRGSPPGAKSCPSIPTRSTVMSPTGCMPGGHGQRWKRTSRRYPGRRDPSPRARPPHRRRHHQRSIPWKRHSRPQTPCCTTLATLADEDAKEDAVLDALPTVAHLDMISWMRLKRQLKRLVPGLNRHDLERAWQELRRTAAQQATPATGRSQAQIAAALAKDYGGTVCV